MHLAAENGHKQYVLTIQQTYPLILMIDLTSCSIVTELQHYWEDSVKDPKQHEATDVGRLLKSVDDDGNTPLHLACKYGYIDIAKTLIKMPGANIGAR